MPDGLVILGAGGSAGDIVWTIDEINRASERWELRGFLDDDPDKHGGSVCGYPILGSFAMADEHGDARFIVGVAHYLRPMARREIVQRLGLPPERYATLLHPMASVSPHASVGAGTLVFQNAVVCHGATVGAHVFVSHQCVVSHDAVVEDFATLASGAILCGGSRLSAAAYAGARAVIKDGVVVGSGAVAGLGSAVFHDVAPGGVVVGNPARAVPSRASRERV
jgi:sugar O-acyltransferase (sialic acid O-acetyltransferase NeuD family)